MIARDSFDLSRPRRLHMAGIGGSGMAPLARILAEEGHAITGADACESVRVAGLRRAGFTVWTGSAGAVLPTGVEGLIHSAAVPESAPVLRGARRRGVAVLKYAQAVGQFSAERRTYAVAGTHGKTTTTGLLAYTFRTCGDDASCLVGGEVPQLGGGAAVGRSRSFIVEACEYDRSFLNLTPEAAIVTNIEADHLDYFKDLVEIREAFRDFAARVSMVLVLHESLYASIGRARGIRARVVTYGTSPDVDLRVSIGGRRGGLTQFRAGGNDFELAMPGRHNVLNAAAVIALCRERGMELDGIRHALRAFSGVGRRLQVVGKPRGVPVVDDYAHHPTEVWAGLETLRAEYQPRRLWCVFQPHQYSRTERFLKEFGRALAIADRVVIPDIFAARDEGEGEHRVSAQDLVDEVRGCGGNAVHLADFGAIVDYVRTQVRTGDVLVTMGAGDVGDVAGRLAQAL